MFKTAMLVLVTLALVAFAAANWAAFSTPTVLTLGVAQFTAPLGVLMLAVLGVVVLLFLASLAVWQARILGDSRRHARPKPRGSRRCGRASARKWRGSSCGSRSRRRRQGSRSRKESIRSRR
jgi:hypothetical protein